MIMRSWCEVEVGFKMGRDQRDNTSCGKFKLDNTKLQY